MSAKPASPEKHAFPRSPEPFPEPNTIPTGWDLSELLASSKSECAAPDTKAMQMKKSKRPTGRVKGSA